MSKNLYQKKGQKMLSFCIPPNNRSITSRYATSKPVTGKHAWSKLWGNVLLKPNWQCAFREKAT